jgi:hypothetical protein
MRQNTWPIGLSYWASCRAGDVRRFCKDYRKSSLLSWLLRTSLLTLRRATKQEHFMKEAALVEAVCRSRWLYCLPSSSPLFPLIVSLASKLLGGCLIHLVTMLGNQVMMGVNHTLVVLRIIRRLLFPSFPLRSDKHSSDGLPHPVHQQHEKFHRDKVQHPSVPSIYSIIDYC